MSRKQVFTVASLIAVAAFVVLGYQRRVPKSPKEDKDVSAVRAVLERQTLTLSDIDLIELNEAFAAQVIACDRDLQFDHERLNPNGGAIALGHPIGCTGARITTTLLYEMKKRNARRGLATLCISGGMGIALLVERS